MVRSPVFSARNLFACGWVPAQGAALAAHCLAFDAFHIDLALLTVFGAVDRLWFTEPVPIAEGFSCGITMLHPRCRGKRCNRRAPGVYAAIARTSLCFPFSGGSRS